MERKTMKIRDDKIFLSLHITYFSFFFFLYKLTFSVVMSKFKQSCLSRSNNKMTPGSTSPTILCRTFLRISKIVAQRSTGITENFKPMHFSVE